MTVRTARSGPRSCARCKARGLAGVQLVISDSHAGLKTAIASVLLGAAWQRCRVHFLRNVLAQVPKGSAEMVAATIRTIFAQPGPAQVREQLGVIAVMLGQAVPKVEASCWTPPMTDRVHRVPGQPLEEDLEHQPAIC